MSSYGLYYLKFPIRALMCGLTPAETCVLLELCRMNLQFCGGDIRGEWFVSNRELAKKLGCSTKTVFQAKKKMKDCHLISFYRGTNGRTVYRILGDDEVPSGIKEKVINIPCGKPSKSDFLRKPVATS